MNFLTSLSESRPRPWLADWFELVALKEGIIRFEDYLDEAEACDTPSEDIDLEERAQENTFDKVLEEIRRRKQWLGPAYPFSIKDGGYSLCLATELSPGMDSYLLCLWLSVVDSEIIQDGYAKINKNEQTLFQWCSTIAAASFLGEYGFSFGFPRVSGGNILKGLSDLHKSGFPEGEPCVRFADWMNTAAKDDEVDVIAWRQTNDTLPGVACLFGQAASGGNWRGKHLSEGKLRSFQSKWYEHTPATTPIRALFIPFCPWPEIMDQSLTDYRKRLSVETMTYGIMFTRYRLPFYVEKHLNEQLGQTNLDNGKIIEALMQWRLDIINRLAPPLESPCCNVPLLPPLAT